MVYCKICTSSFLDNHLQWFPWQLRMLKLEKIDILDYDVAKWRSRIGAQRLTYPKLASIGKNSMRHISWRTFSMPVNVEEKSSSPQSENYSSDDENDPKTSLEEQLEKPLSSDELHVKEGALLNFKSELAVTELEIQTLVGLAEEIAKYGIPEGCRKINGKYIQSHLLLRLKVVHEKLKDQIKDVEAAQSKEVSLFWYGMAESVQVMGTFDGWSQGEHLSPEYTGSYTQFSATLMLRPGRYEIKFLVDGEWMLSPDFPTVGDGLMKNNLLLVE
ncbi:hypothetical protein U1Q18_038619 [Sarracenia purpurea var. burkii]